MAQKIILCKLSSGEEVIASVIKETDMTYLLKKPRGLMVTPVGNNQMSLAMIPWMTGAIDSDTGLESDIYLYRDKIIGESTSIPKALEDNYLSSTSGIQLI